jgi:hypothetical protein
MNRNRESGQALLITALALIVLSGFAGLGIDMGMLRFQKRLQQTSADSAAIAGASNFAYTGYALAAQNAATAAGFTDSDGGAGCVGGAIGCISVKVSNPPTTGPHSAAPAGTYVEVLVTEVHPTFFMRILGVDRELLTARAVATNLGGGTNSGCMYSLGKAPAELHIQGSVDVEAANCGIVDNGNFSVTGNPTMRAASIAVVGTADTGTNVTCTQTTTCPTPGVPVSGDPLAYLTAPAQPAASASCPGAGLCNVTTSGTQTLQPGTYNSITIGSNSTVTMNPGIYYINGSAGVTFNGGGSVTGSGMMFYFTNGATINTTGGGNKLDLALTPPTSGPYAGILMYQDPSDTNGPSLGGDDHSSLGGALYFPSAQVEFFGNAHSNVAGLLVAKSIDLQGNPTLVLQGAAGLPPGVTVIKNAILVE